MATNKVMVTVAPPAAWLRRTPIRTCRRSRKRLRSRYTALSRWAPALPRCMHVDQTIKPRATPKSIVGSTA